VESELPESIIPSNNVHTTVENKLESKTGSKPNINSTNLAIADNNTETSPPQEVIKEVLLCLRPIRDGEKFSEASQVQPSTDVKKLTNTFDLEQELQQQQQQPRATTPTRNCKPMKKRVVDMSTASVHSMPLTPKKSGLEEAMRHSSTDVEKSVVESLMLMSHKMGN